MTFERWLALAGTIALVAFAPGPSIALVWVQRVRFGPRATLPTIAGDLSANMLQLSVAWLGLDGLRGIGLGTRVVGGICACWLAWEGMRQVRQGGRPRRAEPPAPVAGARLDWYLRGFTVSAANPKAILFFLALLPAALAGAPADGAALLTVAVTFAGLDGAALAIYARGGGWLQAVLRRHGREGLEQRIAGGMLLVAAAAMAVRALPG